MILAQGSLILEGASMCLLSKCIPAALKGGKSFLNAGAHSCPSLTSLSPADARAVFWVTVSTNRISPDLHVENLAP